MPQQRISALKTILFFVLIITNSNCFNLRNIFNSLSTQFSAQKENNKIDKQTQEPEPSQLHKQILFLPNRDMPSLVQRNENNLRFGFRQNEEKKQAGDPKQKSIQFGIKTLEGVKESCTSLINEGKKRMDEDYNQCLKTVQNFNCSYANEWGYLKRKHLKNITIMKQEIDASEQAIVEIKIQQQQQNQEKHQIMSQLYPQIMQLTNDIQKVDGIIKYLEGGFLSRPNDEPQSKEKSEEKPATEAPSQQKQETQKTQEQKPAEQPATEQKKTEEKPAETTQQPTSDKTQQPAEETKQPETKQPETTQPEAKQPETKQPETTQPETKQPETNTEQKTDTEKQPATQTTEKPAEGQTKQGRMQTVSERDESAFEKFKQNFFGDDKKDNKKQDVLTEAKRLLAKKSPVYGKYNNQDDDDDDYEDQEEYEQKKSRKHKQQEETIYDLIENSGNLFDSFLQTDIDFYRKPMQIHSSNILKDSDDILSANLILEEEGIYQDQRAGRSELQILIQQLQEQVKIPDNNNIKENKKAVWQQSEVLTKQMIAKLSALLAAMKKEKIEKEKEIVVLDQVNHNEFIVHQDKIASIQLNIAKIEAEVIAKEDWISQLQSKLMDCENQDLMRENCIASKDQDLRYIQQINEMKAIAEGSVQQLQILLEYGGVPIVNDKEEEEKLEKPAADATKTETPNAEQQKTEQQKQQTDQQQQTEQKDQPQQQTQQADQQQTKEEPKVENAEQNPANDERKKEQLFELSLAQLSKQNRNLPRKRKINNQEYILIPASDYEKSLRKQNTLNLIQNTMNERSLNKFKQNNSKQSERKLRNKWY